ncbi:hypothetical protein [Alistipes sp.]|uniref:hypothetical protein n=1 Tax=Alistipes sp. TaxID=1872444 RepID=UPI0025C1A5F8|nr:hypothetical protein [Alistipes sp.]MCI7140508.1 hypothetical protein [Alistipes sp.]MDY5397430.1 hypothetical protein [Alistipes sp.]
MDVDKSAQPTETEWFAIVDNRPLRGDPVVDSGGKYTARPPCQEIGAFFTRKVEKHILEFAERGYLCFRKNEHQ